MASIDQTANTVTISVDGRSGEAAEPFTETSTAALVQTGPGADGANGVNARQARPGEPGGRLWVEIVPDADAMIRVNVTQYQAATVLPDYTYVPWGRILQLTAQGGNGAPGNRGGDGQNGRPGSDGAVATQYTEATNGTNGGRGGNAGAGSNGGIGSAGGIVEVIVEEKHTNLLLAVDWCVDGGKGGRAGENGKPGIGGLGGAGGRPYTWNQEAGFKYKCTRACVDLQKALPDGTSATASPHQQLLGNILQSTIQNGMGSALIPASRIRAAGLCKCQGGGPDATCLACEKVPMTVELSREGGLDGFRGPDGSPSDFTPADGADGIPGLGRITVIQVDGSRQSYTSKYYIELVSFSITDENEDGIIEPGEHIFIHQIVVFNKGGMPTPSETRIPVVARCTEWIEKSDIQEESTIYLPRSIPAGHRAPVPGRIKMLVKSRPPANSKEFEPLFRVTDTVSLQSTMPGLDMELPGFNTTNKEIEISYPVELKLEENLRTVSQGTSSTFSWKVYNRSKMTYGDMSPLGRKIVLCMMANTPTGIRFSSPDTLKTPTATAVRREIVQLHPGESIPVCEKAEVDMNAMPYSTANLSAYLELSPPTSPGRNKAQSDTETIQGISLSVQISPPYDRHPDSSFLLITNSEPSVEIFRAWQEFIETDLKLKLDVWNLSLYGSIDPQDDEDQFGTILTPYAGKSVIMLCNEFDYFSRGKRTVLDFSEAPRIAEEMLQDTRIGLILRASENLEDVKRWMHSVVFPICTTDAKHGVLTPAAVRCSSDIVESVVNHYKFSSGVPAIKAYTLPVKRKKLQNEAERVLRFLSENLPQERFCIKPILGRDTATLLVFRGISRSAYVSARSFHTGGALAAADRLACINSLPFGTRLDLLYKTTDKQITNGLRLSIDYELLRETNCFLETSSWPDTVVPKVADLGFLGLHMKRLYTLLSHHRHSQNLPHHAIESLHVVLSATHTQDLQQFASRLLMPIKNRRTRLRSFLLKCFESLLEAPLDELRARKETISFAWNTKERLLTQIGEFTGQSRYEVESSVVVSGDDIVSEICSEQEWDSRIQEYSKLVEELKLDVDHSSGVLAEKVQMVV